ncbi:hypothetical protein KUTeg_023209 [Tegillarca granosa]|uniref:BEN domain-containing protein n=1 Tax=Tegillarca granosa TaxID=220873 RepID=A0ABQ9E0Z5_TEGGR|nr:hypothetical protein KUTeg_023209 [Tegillarca granosa]
MNVMMKERATCTWDIARKNIIPGNASTILQTKTQVQLVQTLHDFKVSDNKTVKETASAEWSCEENYLAHVPKKSCGSEDRSHDKNPTAAASSDGFDALLDSLNDPELEEEVENTSEELNKLLNEDKEFYDSEDKTSDEIDSTLAETINASVRSSVQVSKIRETRNKYNKPKNCLNLTTPKVKSEIWAEGTSRIVALTQLTNTLIASKKEKKTLNTVEMKNGFRWCLAKPYRKLCNSDRKVTSHLLAEDLPKTIKEIKETTGISIHIRGKNMPKTRLPKNITNPIVLVKSRMEYLSKIDTTKIVPREAFLREKSQVQVEQIATEMSVGSDQEARRSERIRTLTEPANEQYETTLAKHYDKIKEVTRAEIENSKGQKNTLEALCKVLESCIVTYSRSSDILVDFLRGIRTIDSERELLQFEASRDRMLAKVDIAKSKICDFLERLKLESLEEKKVQEFLEERKANLEAHRARLRHLDQELALEAKLKQTRAKRDLDVITSEVNALKATDVSDLAPSMSSVKRTIDYVNGLNEPPHTLQCIFDGNSSLNPTAEPFAPKNVYTQPANNQLIDTFTKHLVKRYLIMSRLSKFDNPMMFLTWKTSIMEEVGALPIEVLELLCQNLGPESPKQAKTIKACNADNPNVAISKIFDRLEKRFCAPELIEKHLHKKIRKFPDVTVDKYY